MDCCSTRIPEKNSWKGQLQLVVPKCLREALIEEIHGGLLAGHFGIDRTLDSVRKRYWWDGMKEDVTRVIRGYPECNASNPRQGKQQPLPQGERKTGIPWERVGIDYTDMAKSKDGCSKILAMIDHATKFVIAKATKDGSAETAAKKLYSRRSFASMGHQRNSGAAEVNISLGRLQSI